MNLLQLKTFSVKYLEQVEEHTQARTHHSEVKDKNEKLKKWEIMSENLMLYSWMKTYKPLDQYGSLLSWYTNFKFLTEQPDIETKIDNVFFAISESDSIRKTHTLKMLETRVV